MYMKNPDTRDQYLATLTNRIKQHTMNRTVDRTGLRDGPYTGIKHIVICRNHLTCIQRICSLISRDNHLHRLTRSEYYVVWVKDVRIWSVGSRADYTCTGNQFIRERVHSSKVESKMGIECARALDLVVAAIKGFIRRSCLCRDSSDNGEKEKVEHVPEWKHGLRLEMDAHHCCRQIYRRNERERDEKKRKRNGV
jgi:hypothetical protein